MKGRAVKDTYNASEISQRSHLTELNACHLHATKEEQATKPAGKRKKKYDLEKEDNSMFNTV